ncbi:MAG: zinc ribbon domain-containing protein [Clostridia bacterium]|nr:zinc ribbon domain-containing protein [Clostridia bacterium]
MAFFEKISEKGQNAVKKGKDFAEITKINSLISDEKKNVNNNYFQIGQLYTQMHANDCEEEFKGMIASIVESENKIAKYKEQIQTIKGIVKCEKCGAEVSNGSAFCNCCGAAIPKKAVEPVVDEDSVACPNCGRAVKKGMRFCTGCGSPMQSLKQQHDTAERICPNCGEKTSDIESAFCNHCGSRLEGTVSVNSPSNIKHCPNCGFSTDDTEIDFCTECGAKLI